MFYLRLELLSNRQQMVSGVRESSKCLDETEKELFPKTLYLLWSFDRGEALLLLLTPSSVTPNHGSFCWLIVHVSLFCAQVYERKRSLDEIAFSPYVLRSNSLSLPLQCREPPCQLIHIRYLASRPTTITILLVLCCLGLIRRSSA